MFEAVDVSVRLGRRRVLEDISFAIEGPTFVTVIGPNGAGKSTLLRTLAGLLPYEGFVRLEGREVSDWRPAERARRVAYVEQSPPLAFALTVRDVVSLGRAPHLGWFASLTEQDARLVDEALAVADLSDLAGRPATALSGGERQRVALARGLAQATPALLLDEPTAHLDIRHRLSILRHAARLAASGRTVVAALHDIRTAVSVSDRLLVLDRGRLVADGTPADVATPELLRDVFGVDAEVDRSGSGVEVRYLDDHIK